MDELSIWGSCGSILKPVWAEFQLVFFDAESRKRLERPCTFCHLAECSALDFSNRFQIDGRQNDANMMLKSTEKTSKWCPNQLKIC